jgi:hypothetical protein
MNNVAFAITIAQVRQRRRSIKPTAAVNNRCARRRRHDGAISRRIRYNFIFTRGFNPTEAFMG